MSSRLIEECFWYDEIERLQEEYPIFIYDPELISLKGPKEFLIPGKIIKLRNPIRRIKWPTLGRMN